jgi:GMP synthase (glutamine-hydrolysing)
MSASVLVLQHAAAESPGIIEEVLRARGVPIDVVHTQDGAPVPESIRGRLGLVVMGGPMGVYEQPCRPHLAAEIRLIRCALEAEIPTLGICLGSQLLAAALGAHVEPATREIGWYPVHLAEAAAKDPLWSGVESPFTPLHWHGDAFELPPGAIPLASSERTDCQAFAYRERAYGFLFHLEVTESMVRAMAGAFPDELASAGVDPEDLVSRAVLAIPAARTIANRVFGRWADLLAPKGHAVP